MLAEAFYEDPKNKRVHKKVAVVIPAYLVTKNYGYYKEDKEATLLLNLKAHLHFKAGVDYDIIINNRGNKLTPKILAEIEKFKDSNGNSTVLLMQGWENEGFSFGAWKQAWENCRGTYEYYLFVEDDMAPAKDLWLLEFVDKFISDRDIGAIGNFLESRCSTEPFSEELWKDIGYTRDTMYNFDGSYTFTSSKILKEVDEHGGLLVLPCEPLFKDRPATINECIFQQPILELGYKLYAWKERYVVHGSELFTGDVAAEPIWDIAPLMNLNGIHKIPRVKEVFKPLLCDQNE